MDSTEDIWVEKRGNGIFASFINNAMLMTDANLILLNFFPILREYILSSGDWKTLEKRDIIAQLLEWLNSIKLTIPNAGEAVKLQELSFIAGGNRKWNHFARESGNFSLS